MLKNIKRKAAVAAIILILTMAFVPCTIYADNLQSSGPLIATYESEDEAEDFQKMSFLPPILIVLGVIVVGGFGVWLLRRR